ncbi:hypothetical protein [Marisediminicola senii]|uniref:hypothetical protein n=1 Tax=Marisediminicola senii TaxID=2711233 RepID=UPI0013EDB418|nr:hypothetical protein [Marisediminicola senii]
MNDVNLVLIIIALTFNCCALVLVATNVILLHKRVTALAAPVPTRRRHRAS